MNKIFEKSSKFRFLSIIFVALLMLVGLTSCGSKDTMPTYDSFAEEVYGAQLEERNNLKTYIEETLEVSNEAEKEQAKVRINYFVESLNVAEYYNDYETSIKQIITKIYNNDSKLDKDKMLVAFSAIKTDAELKSITVTDDFNQAVKSKLINNVEYQDKAFSDNILSQLTDYLNKIASSELKSDNTALLEKIYNDVNEMINNYVNMVATVNTKSLEDVVTKVIEKATVVEDYKNNGENVKISSIKSVTVKTVKEKLGNYKDSYTKKSEDYRKKLIDQAITKYTAELYDANSANKDTVVAEKVENSGNVYQIIKNYTIDVADYTSSARQEPLGWKKIDSFGAFFTNFFNNFLIFPIGWLMKTISALLGGYYIFGILFATIIVRTIAWPVYAKTNDMSLKMQLMQPELNKIEAKYANRPDPDSQNAKRMEQAQIYKKYKVGIGGCLMQFIQFPIFIAIYRAINRMPFTNGSVPGTSDWVSSLKHNIGTIDLFAGRGELWSNSFWGIILIMCLVLLTQQINQKISEQRQKDAQAKSQQNIPEYRRQAASQNNNNGTMKYMMIFLSVMMVIFVWQSAAGLGVYWIIGNLYSILQAALNNKFSDKRAEKLRKKYNS